MQTCTSCGQTHTAEGVPVIPGTVHPAPQAVRAPEVLNDEFPDVRTDIPEASAGSAVPNEEDLDVFPEVTSLPKEKKQADAPNTAVQEPKVQEPEMPQPESLELEAAPEQNAPAQETPEAELIPEETLEADAPEKVKETPKAAKKPALAAKQEAAPAVDVQKDAPKDAPEEVQKKAPAKTAEEVLLDPELLPADSLNEVLPEVPGNGAENPTLDDEFLNDMIDLENSLKEAPEPNALPNALPDALPDAEPAKVPEADPVQKPAEKPADKKSADEEPMIDMPELQIPLSGQQQKIKPFRVTMISAAAPAPVLKEVQEPKTAVSPETKEAELRLQALDAPEKRPSFAQPADEYVIDSKVGAQKVKVSSKNKGRIGNTELSGNWEMDFQDQRGTFIYFDDGTGRATVQTPDPVYIYAPRFRAVRQVVDLNVDEQVMSTGDLFTPTSVQIQERNAGTNTTLQQVQAGTQAGRDVMIQTKGSDGTREMDAPIGAQAYNQEAVIAQESRTMEGPVAAEGKIRANTVGGMDMASTWTMNDQLQVFIDKQSASASVMNLAAPSLYTVKEGENKHSVRIYKVASKTSAKPGETVDFVIYFENTGSAPVGNISLVDNLPTRLEIVEDSAESSVDASFTYEVNGAGSQTLRWEVTQPLYPKEKGAVKFRALVR